MSASKFNLNEYETMGLICLLGAFLLGMVIGMVIGHIM